MDTLITAVAGEPNSLREYFEISKDIKDARLTPGIAAASRRLRAWVGDEAYADALLEVPVDADRAADLTSAEAWLAMYFALLGMNTKITPGGVVKTSKVEGNTTHQYLTPGEMRELACLYFDQAHEIARRYMLTDETPDAEFSVVDEEAS
jgi:hypothetical protein